MKGKKVIIGILLAILVAGGIGFFIFSKRQKEEPKNEIAQEQPKQEVAKTEEVKKVGYNAQIEYLQGQVEKRESENDGWKNAEKGQVLKSGVELRTFAASKAVLTFEDGSIARLDQNTQIKMVTEEKKIVLEMPNGFVFNNVVKDASREYMVKSGGYSMKALGTIFSVSKQKEGEPELMVLESEVEVRKGTGEKLDSAKMGEKIAIFKSKSEKKKMVKKDIEGEFVAWSIKEGKVKTDFFGESASAQESSVSKITLSGKASEDGVKLSWQASGISELEGFKVIKSTDINPVYPGDSAQYIAKTTSSYIWNITDGKKYHFRVCAYVGGKCNLYSNDAYVQTLDGENEDSDDEDYASSITLSKYEDGDDIYLKWTISGGDAPKGYKVVKSKDKNPEYPDDGYYKYISDEDTKKVKLEGFDSDDTYHFRVCIYKGGSCGAYSNDVEIDF